MTIGVSDAMAGVGLFAGGLGLVLSWRQRRRQSLETGRLLEEMDRGRLECLDQISRVGVNLETLKRNTQSSPGSLPDGPLGVSARGRALRMLRSGMAAETAAAELGMPRNEVRLLEKVAAVLAPRS